MCSVKEQAAIPSGLLPVAAFKIWQWKINNIQIVEDPLCTTRAGV